MARRQRVFDIIRKQFRLFGFQPLETPAMENLSMLTGKYGEEGDRLIYKVLNSGNYAEGITPDDLHGSPAALAAKICDRALRYDLTVPFARYVAMNKGQLTLPFRRYQMQPVWRADRPQKGRYREFYQCDADIVGTESLVCEGELLALLYRVFSELGLGDKVVIKLNSRKLLSAIAVELDIENQIVEFTTALDKLDKIGIEGVLKELIGRGFQISQLNRIQDLLERLSWKNEGFKIGEYGDDAEKLHNVLNQFFQLGYLNSWFTSESAKKLSNEAYNDFKSIIHFSINQGLPESVLEFDPTLARGLDYYTGAIIEVKVPSTTFGSIAGGGRYDNLTAVFGVPDVPGVGVSFGIDRICDVMEELKLFTDIRPSDTEVLVCSLDADGLPDAARIVSDLRLNGIPAELYPEAAKLKKQLGYADKTGVPHVVILGSEEIEKKEATLRNLADGSQARLPQADLVDAIRAAIGKAGA